MFVLLHSPLVGPFTWTLVAEELRRRAFQVVVPRLSSPPDIPSTYWERHVDEAVRAIKSVSDNEPLILVAHSGSGVLLPVLGQKVEQPVTAYIFVDALLPQDSKSRLELFESNEVAEQFRQAASNGVLSPWTDSDLREAIPDAAVRERFVADLCPLPLMVYEEPVPVFEGWPDAPCGYLRFGSNPAYDDSAMLAKQRGWEYLKLEGQHFLMLVKPATVVDALLALIERIDGSP